MPDLRSSRSVPHRRLALIPLRVAGFTLIELLVVVALLSAVTLLAFDVSTDDRTQLRYNDTRQRLQALERAILGRLGPSDPATLGGFVADNGRLPENIAELLSASSLTTQTVLKPLFDPQPDTSTCANNGGETELSEAAAQLIKGHRGSYLGGLAFNGRFRDGWGNENGDAAADAANFGWNYAVDNVANPPQLKITSLGLDNDNNGSGFATDVATTIRAFDWQVPIGGWTVRVFNYSGSDIAANTVSASLLVFYNGSSGTQWIRYSSSTNATCVGNGSTLCPTSAALTFSSSCYPSDSATGHGNIPQGRHILVLINDTDGQWSTGDAVRRVGNVSTNPPIVTQITAVAGMALPETRLEIR